MKAMQCPNELVREKPEAPEEVGHSTGSGFISEYCQVGTTLATERLPIISFVGPILFARWELSTGLRKLYCSCLSRI